MCKMHYHRWYRHGDVHFDGSSRAASGVTVNHGRWYRTVYLPGHPLAGRSGKVYVHRKVLFDRIGPGWHRCHWCDRPVQWAPGSTGSNALFADHLDNHSDNNEPANLVPSCRNCNPARGTARRHVALRDRGWWSNNDTVNKLGPRQLVGQ